MIKDHLNEFKVYVVGVQPHQTTMICAFCSFLLEYKKIHHDFPASREPAYNSSISLSSFAASFSANGFRNQIKLLCHLKRRQNTLNQGVKKLCYL